MSSLINLYKQSFSGLSKEVWALSLVTLINRSGTIVVLFLSIYLVRELNFTMGQAGIIMSFFGVGSVIGTYVGGKLTDIIGYYKVQLWSLLLSSVMFFVLIFLKSFWALSIGVFLTSFIGDMFRPANLAAIAMYSRPENRTRSVSLIRLAINIGFTAGPALGGLLAYKVGYEWLFILDGATCLLAGIFFFIVLPEVKSPKKSEEEKAAMEFRAISPAKNKRFLVFVSLILIHAVVFFQLFTTLPYYLESYFKMTESQIGLLLGLNGFMIAVIEMPLVFKLEHKYDHLGLVSIGTLLVGLSCAFFAFGSTWIILPIAYFIVVTIAEIIIFPFTNTWALNQADETNRGVYMAYYAMAFSIAHIIAPLGMNVAESFGWNTMWILSTIIGVLTGFGYYLLYRWQ